MEMKNPHDENAIHKGVLVDKRMRLWDEFFPLNSKNSPSIVIAPMPTGDSDQGFASFSLGKKICVITGWSVIALGVLACAVSYFMI